jgi:hypothetical protein
VEAVEVVEVVVEVLVEVLEVEVVDRDIMDPLLNEEMHKEVYIKVWEWKIFLPHHHLVILL